MNPLLKLSEYVTYFFSMLSEYVIPALRLSKYVNIAFGLSNCAPSFGTTRVSCYNICLCVC